MADYVYYTWVTGHPRRIEPRKPKDSSFIVECAYCEGKGMNEDYVYGTNRCAARCNGGWLKLPGKPEDYRRCGPCEGTGEIKDYIYGDHVCKTCRGSGLVKVG
jgi:DnaJ-class molecular chaperone